jgi:hypothetical protein
MIKEALLNIDTEKLSNMIERVLSLRELGNKLHGDSLEVGLNGIINDETKFKSVHVGKEFFRSGLASDLIIGKRIEDINEYQSLLRELKVDSIGMLRELSLKYGLVYTNKNDTKIKICDLLMSKISKIDIESLSLKCYGEGPLQLSTNPTSSLIDACLYYVSDGIKTNQNLPLSILESDAFISLRLSSEKILAVVYNELALTYSITLIDIDDILSNVSKIIYTPKIKRENSFTYEIVKFYDNNDQYLFEVRYGKKDANALQRGLWTKTSGRENKSFDYIIKNKKYSKNIEFLNKFAKLISSGIN